MCTQSPSDPGLGARCRLRQQLSFNQRDNSLTIPLTSFFLFRASFLPEQHVLNPSLNEKSSPDGSRYPPSKPSHAMEVENESLRASSSLWSYSRTWSSCNHAVPRFCFCRGSVIGTVSHDHDGGIHRSGQRRHQPLRHCRCSADNRKTDSGQPADQQLQCEF